MYFVIIKVGDQYYNVLLLAKYSAKERWKRQGGYFLIFLINENKKKTTSTHDYDQKHTGTCSLFFLLCMLEKFAWKVLLFHIIGHLGQLSQYLIAQKTSRCKKIFTVLLCQ